MKNFMFILWFLGMIAPVHAEKLIILGDVEGQWSRMESFLKDNPGFSYDSNSKTYSLKKGYRLVFMGDASDRGPDSIKILIFLNYLKSTSSAFVTLLMGNRDINKLRLVYELSPEGLKAAPNEDAAKKGFREWLKENGISETLYSDGPTRLKWILEQTMGSPKAYEFRKTELEELIGRKVTDEEIVKSFQDDYYIKQYLMTSQLGFVSKKHRTLFVHGALTPKSYLYIPNNEEKKFKTLDEWVTELNRWAFQNVLAGLLMTTEDNGKALVDYQQPLPGTIANQGSVVYGRNFDATANPELFPEELQQQLLDQGIDTLIVGHTPVGEVPVILSNGHFRIIFVDTSYSSSAITAQVLISEDGTVDIKSRALEIPHHITHKLGTETIIGQKTATGIVINDRGTTFKIDKEAGFKPGYTEPLSCKEVL